MTIASGETSGRFPIVTGGVSNDGEIRLTVTGGGETLTAMMRLLPDEDGREGLHNAAASRAYYAAYLAVAHVAQREGIDFTAEDKD